jgi:Predicted nucleic acid-binding protein, contains PIN domain
MRIVLDTNCLLASLSKKGAYFNVWKSLQQGKYTLCVSNEILEEYEEILAQNTNSVIASNVIQTLLNAPTVEQIEYFLSIQPDNTRP